MSNISSPYRWEEFYSYTNWAGVGYNQTPITGPTKESRSYNAINSREGANFPNFAKVIHSGGNATTTLTGTKSVVDGSHFGGMHTKMLDFVDSQGKHYFGYDESGPVGTFTSSGFPAISIGETTADNQAKQYLYGAIRELHTSMQGMVFLGEFAEALRMIRHPAGKFREQLGKYLNQVQRLLDGKMIGRRVRGTAKALAETWLEATFGWNPLIHDIQDAIKAYRKLSNKVKTRRLRRVGTDETVSFPTVNQTIGGSSLPKFYNVQRTQQCKVIYNVGVRSRISAVSASEEVFERFGLVWSQFVPTMWELMPWSFLLDYFINIGAILNAGAVNTSDVTWVSKTVRKRVTDHRWTIPNWDALDVRCIERSGGTGFVELSKTTVVRTIPTGLSLPTLQASLPGRSVQWMNMAALLIAQKKLLWQLQK